MTDTARLGRASNESGYVDDTANPDGTPAPVRLAPLIYLTKSKTRCAGTSTTAPSLTAPAIPTRYSYDGVQWHAGRDMVGFDGMPRWSRVEGGLSGDEQGHLSPGNTLVAFGCPHGGCTFLGKNGAATQPANGFWDMWATRCPTSPRRCSLHRTHPGAQAPLKSRCTEGRREGKIHTASAMNRSALLASLVCAVMAPAAEAATTVVFRDGVSPTAAYAGTRDVITYSMTDLFWDPNAVYNNAELHADNSPALESSLMAWDVSAIPPGAAVNSATLTLDVTAFSAYPVPLFACLRPWVEGQVTWNQYRAGSPWQTPGGQGALDRGTVVLGTFNGTALGATTVTLNAAGVAVVQGWVDTPATNYGLAINDLGSSDSLIWSSAEHPTPSRRPRLTITYNGGTVLQLQQGVLPSAAYAGARDQGLGSGPDPATRNHNASGQLDMWGGTGKMGTLIQWDVSAIPAWATVSAAALLVNCRGNAGAASYPAYELLRPWVESEVTWTRYTTANLWTTPGADSPQDRGSAVIAVATCPSAGAATWPLTAAGVTLAQRWVAGTTPSRGILFQDYTVLLGMSIDRRENTTLSLRPGLSITYTEGALIFSPPSGTVTAGAASAAMSVQRQALGGAPVAAGAPLLTVALTSPSPTVEFATSTSGPWSSSLNLPIPAGAAATAAFFIRDATSGARTLNAAAGTAWNAGSASWTVVPPGAPLQLVPTSANVAPREPIVFSASGGTPGYTWTLLTNGSGGSVDAAGRYTAGATASTTDVVRVTDNVGATATATLTLGPGVSLSPPSASVAPRQALNFVASGGAGSGFTWSLLTNASGGTVNALGEYQAGPTGDVSDVLQAIDPLGNAATATVAVGPALRLSPAAVELTPREQTVFATSGGLPPYAFDLPDGADAGTLESDGRYTAGTTAERVRVTDALGATAESQVSIRAGSGILHVGCGCAEAPALLPLLTVLAFVRRRVTSRLRCAELR